MVGIDIMEIEEVEKVDLARFLAKYFTAAEAEYVQSKFNKFETLAGLFCAKEALMKCFGLGVGQIALKDIEILHLPSGAPYVVNSATLQQLLQQHGKTTISVSISHSKKIATAICMVE